MPLGDRMLARPIERDVSCSNCKKMYHQRLEDQAVGFRIKDDDMCPYCGYVNRTSMSVEFFNTEMEEYNDSQRTKAQA